TLRARRFNNESGRHGVLLVVVAPLPAFLVVEAGARPDHPISGYQRPVFAATHAPDPLSRLLYSIRDPWSSGRPMKRRDFITLLGGAAAAWPLAAPAQPPARMRRIGVLMGGAGSDPVDQARLAAFLEGLQQLGWTDGRNVRIDIRWPAGDADRNRT